MSTDDDGVDFFEGLLEDTRNGEESEDEMVIEEDGIPDDDESQYTSQTIDPLEETDIYGNTVNGPEEEEAEEASEEGAEPIPLEVGIAADTTSTAPHKTSMKMMNRPSLAAAPLLITILQMERRY